VPPCGVLLAREWGDDRTHRVLFGSAGELAHASGRNLWLPHPLYWSLVPFGVAVDAATLPAQALVLYPCFCGYQTDTTLRCLLTLNLFGAILGTDPWGEP